jgi:hypothetical protein
MRHTYDLNVLSIDEALALVQRDLDDRARRIASDLLARDALAPDDLDALLDEERAEQATQLEHVGRELVAWLAGD